MTVTLYMTNNASSVLASAAKLVTATGAAITNKNSPIGQNTGYGEGTSKGTAQSWAAAASIGNPSGLGWFWDVSTLWNQRIGAGTWTPTFHLGVSAGNITADLHMRAFLYSGGTYTQIGSDVTYSGRTINTTAADFTWPGTSLPAQVFRSGQYLYIDLWPNVTVNNTGSGGAAFRVYTTSSPTQGNTSAQLILPAYVYVPASTGIAYWRRKGNRGRSR